MRAYGQLLARSDASRGTVDRPATETPRGLEPEDGDKDRYYASL